VKILAEILKKLVEQNKAVLNDERVTNTTLIGNMYEGLTKEILEQIDLSSYGVKVVSGVIISGEDQTDQIDCMVVYGDGEPIPCTSDYYYPIEQVIAVFEVKKELLSGELRDAYDQLGKVFELSKKYYARQEEKGLLNFGTARAAQEFETLFGRPPGRYEENAKLPMAQRVVYHSLVRDWLTPLRIAIGYNGYKSERGFRKGVFRLYQGKEELPGYGVINMPNLMISDGYSIIKLNGMPYQGLWSDEHGGWCWLASSSVNPMLLVMELLYDRVEMQLDVNLGRGLDQDEEPSFPLLFSTPEQRVGAPLGWRHQFNDVAVPSLAPEQYLWEPVKVSDFEIEFLRFLHQQGPQSRDSNGLVAFMAEHGIEEIASLLGERIVLEADGIFSPSPKPWSAARVNGEWYCGDDSDSRFKNWLTIQAKRGLPS
jgi:hypothetical protein